MLYRFVEGMGKKPVVWYEHDYLSVKDGLNGHTGHPEVESHLHIIKSAIENPNEVRQDVDCDSNKCYYSWFAGDHEYPNNHMKVVLGRNFFGKIVVVTAYFTSYFKKGEKTIWSKT